MERTELTSFNNVGEYARPHHPDIGVLSSEGLLGALLVDPKKSMVENLCPIVEAPKSNS